GAYCSAPWSLGWAGDSRGVPVQSLLSQFKGIVPVTHPEGPAVNQTERPPTCRTSATTLGTATPLIVGAMSSTEPTSVPAASRTSAADPGPCGPTGPTIPAGPAWPGVPCFPWSPFGPCGPWAPGSP